MNGEEKLSHDIDRGGSFDPASKPLIVASTKSFVKGRNRPLSSSKSEVVRVHQKALPK